MDDSARRQALHRNAVDYRPRARALPDERLAILRSPHLDSTFRASFAYPDAVRAVEAVQTLRVEIARAPLYWCSADMVALVEAAHPTMPNQKLEEIDPPSARGLVFMETPFTDPDTSIFGANVPTNAFLWMVNFVTDRNIWAVNIVSLTNAGDDVGWFVPGFETWPVGERRQDAANPIDVSDRGRLAALWTMAQQPRICPPTTTHPDRPTARRVKAAGLPPEAGDVRVIDLRRPSGATPGSSSTVEYSHRWMVSGHWRNQWMPASKTHRAQWIAPHVKGPEDKPLVVREDVRVIR